LPASVWTDTTNQAERIASTLGNGKGLIMQNRGILLVGKTIECPMSYYIRMESLCKAQLLAEAAVKGRGGELVIVGEQEVKVSPSF
jgi:ribulose-5-phosphate 4-epimerase/fuculose-1-phosphate aldolase